jgi:hypothetical protein
VDALAGDCINTGALKKPFVRDFGTRMGVQVGTSVHMLKKAFVTTLATVYGNRDDRALRLERHCLY